jgi:hypothetical protein
LLVPGVGCFEALAFGGQLRGEGRGGGCSGAGVLGAGVGGLPVGVGFGLSGEPELAADVGRSGGLGALALEGAGFELAAVQAAEDVGFVAVSRAAKTVLRMASVRYRCPAGPGSSRSGWSAG